MAKRPTLQSTLPRTQNPSHQETRHKQRMYLHQLFFSLAFRHPGLFPRQASFQTPESKRADLVVPHQVSFFTQCPRKNIGFPPRKVLVDLSFQIFDEDVHILAFVFRFARLSLYKGLNFEPVYRLVRLERRALHSNTVFVTGTLFIDVFDQTLDPLVRNTVDISEFDSVHCSIVVALTLRLQERNGRGRSFAWSIQETCSSPRRSFIVRCRLAQLRGRWWRVGRKRGMERVASSKLW
ncbi:hypothetical protein IWZ00DRAFT_518507 [Phyllosticta capitalensis]